MTSHPDLNEGQQRDSGEESEIARMSPNDILRSVHEMFVSDAESEGPSFAYVPTSTNVPVEPLAVMRIVTNLVSNAIKYTDEGKVLVGVRRMPGGVCVEKHHMGPGLTRDAFNQACKRPVRLATSQYAAGGHGFGLDIVAELVER